jgi:hypothetical protein
MQYDTEEIVTDQTKTSFIFSLTNNDKFILEEKSKAVFRLKDKSLVKFGSNEFVICDSSNAISRSCTHINRSYSCQNYSQYGKQSYIRLNGNETQYFTTKEW